MPTSIYGGVPTFMNLPVIERPDQPNQVDVAFMGVPWEGGCTIGGFSSCTDGPKSIREASLRYTGFLPEFDLDCYDYLKAADYGDHKKELQNAKDHGATVITAMEVRENGWKAAITKVLEIAAKDVDELYISICSDCLDAAFMPQGPQDMGGLTSYDMLMMLRECGKAGATGFDFVEIYPDAFSLQTASHVGCWFALYTLNGIAERVKNEK